MASSFSAPAFPASVDAVLSNLPVSNAVEYRKGQIVYGPHSLSTNLYLVVDGTVKISRIVEGGDEEVLLEIVRPDELFGQSSFLAIPNSPEQAAALENARIKTWPMPAVEDLVTKRPRLAVALLQIYAQRNLEFGLRIESFSIDTIEQRLARSLLRLSERLGAPADDGSVRMKPLTHHLLSRHVGSTREIVTHYMNVFRKRGYLTYTRQGITLQRDALAGFLVRPARA